MSAKDAGKSRADIELPSWFWNGNPARLVVEAQLHTKVDRARNTSWVQTEESYYRRRPDLVTVTDLAGPAAAERFENLDVLKELAPHEVSPSVIAALEARRRRAQQPGQPVDALALMQLELLVAPVGELGSVAKHYFDELREIELEGDPDEKVFRNASSHLVKRSHSLIWRAKIASIMFQMEQDPDL